MRFDQINWKELEEALNEAEDHDDGSICEAIRLLNKLSSGFAVRLFDRLQQKEDEKNEI